MPSEVKFRNYREHVATRVAANNSMIALLAGARLASHTLQLTIGSAQLLPAMFPSVKDIDRFNLVPDNARLLLDDADSSLATVAVPFALSIHEDFVVGMLTLLSDFGVPIVPQGTNISAGSMHKLFFTSTGQTSPTSNLELFHVIREMRNSQIHSGGVASSRLKGKIQSLSLPARSSWLRLTGQSYTDILDSDDRVVFTMGHMIASFAIVKQLGRDVNNALALFLTKSQWAEIAVADFAVDTAQPRNSPGWKRSLTGFARFNYGRISLSDTDLENASRTGGFWTAHNW